MKLGPCAISGQPQRKLHTPKPGGCSSSGQKQVDFLAKKLFQVDTSKIRFQRANSGDDDRRKL
jgi:hypothetical protein